MFTSYVCSRVTRREDEGLSHSTSQYTEAGYMILQVLEGF